MPFIKHISLFAIILFSSFITSGCSTFCGRSRAESFIGGEVYPSMRSDSLDYLHLSRNSSVSEFVILAIPVFLIDLPFSLTFDTLMLPFDYTVYKIRFAANRPDLDLERKLLLEALEKKEFMVSVNYSNEYPLLDFKGERIIKLNADNLEKHNRNNNRPDFRKYKEKLESPAVSPYENVSFLKLVSARYNECDLVMDKDIKNDALKGRTFKGAGNMWVLRAQIFKIDRGTSHAVISIDKQHGTIEVKLDFQHH